MPNTVRCQLPIVLNDWSEPEPDIAVCVPDPDDYSRAHPQPGQLLLLIEVADASLTYEQSQKAAAYAANGIPALWLVNLLDRRLEVLTAPATGSYRQQRYAFARDGLPLPGGSTIAVADILPRP